MLEAERVTLRQFTPDDVENLVELDGDPRGDAVDQRRRPMSREDPRRGPPRPGVTGFALLNLQERGQMFIGPGVEIYERMVVGENARAEDLDVDPAKEKKLTNVRSSTADELVRLIPPRPLSLEQALEFISEDECVEVTPQHVRLRKVELSAQKRQTGGVAEGAGACWRYAVAAGAEGA